MTAAEIRDRLAERIASLAADLLPGGHREGAEWVASIRDERSPSLKVHLVGDKAGVWCDFGTGEGGDALDLVARVRCGGDISAAMRWAAGWLGEKAWPGRPAPQKTAETPLFRLAPEPSSLDWARAIWRRSVPAEGTPVQTYLEEARRVFLPSDVDIRFCADARNWTGAGAPWPAMLCPMTDAETCQQVGVHVTRIKPDGSGKDGGEKAKFTLGQCGPIRLVDDMDVTLGLGLAEGVETALAVMMYLDWRPVWATTSAGIMRRFPVLPGICCITLFADNDARGTGQDAARECAARWIDAGKEAQILAPPEVGTDFNDMGAAP